MSISAHSTVSLAQSRGLAVDAKSLDSLNHLAGQDAKSAIKETASQFEALFMKELLKSMREATMKSGLMDNEEGDLGTQLLDEQWSVQMTGLPGGLSEMIERQLSQQVTPNAALPGQAVSARPAAPVAGRAEAATSTAPLQATPTQASFVAQHRQAAQQVARESGIPASFMIGQAAHETGWGRSEIKHADGRCRPEAKPTPQGGRPASH